MSTIDLAPDLDRAVEFLKRWMKVTGSTSVVLSAGPTDPVTGEKGKGFPTQSFTDLNAARNWIDEHQREGNWANIYFSVNTPRAPEVTERLARTDISAMVALQVDKDVEPGENQDEGIARIVGIFRKHPMPPSVIVASGGGAQAFWILREPVPVNGDLAVADDLGLYNKKLAQQLDGDSCFSIDHVMRLPRTVNLPNAVKRAKGREPRLATLIEFNDTTYDLGAFEKAAPEKPPAEQRFMPSGKYEPIEQDDAALKVLEPVWLALARDGDTEGKYLGKDCKLDRSKALFAFAAAAKRAGVADDVLARVIMDSRWRVGDCIRDKAGETKRQLRRIVERANDAAVDADLDELNERHAVIEDLGGKCVVANETFDPQNGQTVVTLSSFEALANRYSNRRKKVSEKDDGTPITKPLAEWWTHHKRRRQYRHITFAPGQFVPDALNMWRGFSVEPAAGDCSLYLRHVEENICGGDQKLYNYILDWMASGVQHPEDPGRTAISLRGFPGDGKGVFVLGYGRLFGRHLVHVTQPEQLRGKFNAHEAEAVLVFADEVAFAGDSEAARIFKTKISETTKLLERKGYDAVQVDNYARYIFSTNDGHPLPVEHNDRRYLAVHVRSNALWVDEHDQEVAADLRRAYFMPVIDELRQGGRAALLDMLLKRDLSGFNAEAFPRTDEGNRQKQLSAPDGDKVVMTFATEGRLPGALANRPHIAVSGQKGDRALLDAMRERGGRTLQFASDMTLTEILKAWEFKPHRLNWARGWRAPPLADLRAAIERRYPSMRGEWDTSVVDWDQPEGPVGREDNDNVPMTEPRQAGIPF